MAATPAGGSRIELDPSWARVQAALLEAGPTMRREMYAAIRREAPPIIKSMQESVRGVSFTDHTDSGGDHTGLREAAAQSVGMQIKSTGVYIRSRSSRMPTDQKTLAKRMNRGTWRHPLFGRTKSDNPGAIRSFFGAKASTGGWYEQTAKPDHWFDAPAVAAHPRLRYAVEKVIRSTLYRIARSS